MDSDLEPLGERIAEQAAHLDAAMYRFLTDLREFDERGIRSATRNVTASAAVTPRTAWSRSKRSSIPKRRNWSGP